MPVDLRGRDLLSIRDLSRAEILAVLDRAERMKARRRTLFNSAPLAGKTLAMVFQKPSLRTRVSFEAGMTLLGGHAVYLAPGDIRLGERETIEDVAIVLSRYADLIVARVFGHQIVEHLARHAAVPVINGLSDFEHPCQILADLMTIRERKGRLAGLKVVFVGDGNNVANSLMFAAARLGVNLTVASPSGFAVRPEVLRQARQMAAETGARLATTHDPRHAAEDADVLYTDVWTSMGQEAEARARRRKFRRFRLDAELTARARPDAVILHCLPAHYGEEIDYQTARAPNSAIFDQAENRLHAQNALLVLLVGGRSAGRLGRRR